MMLWSFPKVLFWIIGAALLVRLLFLILIVVNLGEEALLVSDAPRFLKIAEALVAGHGFTHGEAPFVPSAFFPPVFLSVLGASLVISGSVIPAVFLHVVLGATLPIFVWLVAGFLTEKRGVRLFAAGLAAFEPQMILWSIVPTTEMIAVFTLTVALYFFLKFLIGITEGMTGSRTSHHSHHSHQNDRKSDFLSRYRWQDIGFSAIFLGLSVLTRPHAQFLFIAALAVLIIFALAQKISWRHGAVFTGVFFAVLFPWLVRNYVEFGTVSVSTTGLRNIYSDYAVATRSIATGVPFGELRAQMYDELAEKLGVTSKEVREDPAFGNAVAKEGVKIILQYPKEAIQVAGIALTAFFTQDLYLFYLEHFRVIPERAIDFSPSVILVTEGPVELAQRVWAALGISALIPVLARLFWIGLTIFGVVGAVAAFRRGGWERGVALALVLMILYYAATSVVGAFSDQGRLRFPVNSLIFILASYGSWEFFQNIKRRRAVMLSS